MAPSMSAKRIVTSTTSPMGVTLRFPDDFEWGTATASYQIEGAATEHRDPSIWDQFSATLGKVRNGDTGAVACDHYHRFREDVQLIRRLNTRVYRFSLAWTRIQKFDADLNAAPNEEGIAFYNALIDELLANGITPLVTLYHWDLPLALQDALSGWTDPTARITHLFADYAALAFDRFGDRVHRWLTLNEPWCSTFLAYETGEHAPGLTNSPGVAVYRAGHNLLLAHARAVAAFRKRFPPSNGHTISDSRNGDPEKVQSGSQPDRPETASTTATTTDKADMMIGISLNSNWTAPRDPSDDACVAGAARAVEFELGWFADPVWRGEYPSCMREAAGERLPRFTVDEQRLLRGSADFFALNHYSTSLCERAMTSDERAAGAPSYEKDRGVVCGSDATWRTTDMGWAVCADGFRSLLEYIQRSYVSRGGIYVTENGLAVRERNKAEAAANGDERIRFYKEYIAAMHGAMAGKVRADVRGYYLWSLMDNFEWAWGYEKRFGLYFVDYDSLERVEKPAVEWYSQVAKTNEMLVPSAYVSEVAGDEEEVSRRVEQKEESF